jgi:hypothetical protein
VHPPAHVAHLAQPALAPIFCVTHPHWPLQRCQCSPCAPLVFRSDSSIPTTLTNSHAYKEARASCPSPPHQSFSPINGKHRLLCFRHYRPPSPTHPSLPFSSPVSPRAPQCSRAAVGALDSIPPSPKPSCIMRPRR